MYANEYTICMYECAGERKNRITSAVGDDGVAGTGVAGLVNIVV